MKRKFIGKKKKINIRLLVYILLILTSFNATLKLLLDGKESNKDFLIGVLLNDALKSDNVLLSTLSAKITEPKEMLYLNLNKSVSKDNLSVFSNIEDDDFTYEDEITNYIEDPNPIEIEEPLVYIYNSHQTEEYSQNNPLDYSVKPNVMIASYIMRENLNEKGIPSIVETANIKEYLTTNGLKYSYSYVASRYYIMEALKENKSIKYLIDIHRDSVNIDKTLYEHDNKKYARILFVVGMEHDEYEKNLALAETLNKKIEEKYSGLSRGISKKSGTNVNGIYNQDLSENAILIEIGGVDNEIEEVYNTVGVISEVLTEYIKETEYGE